MLYIGLDTQQKEDKYTPCKRSSKKWPKSQLCGFERLEAPTIRIQVYKTTNKLRKLLLL
jgi:hypothetical protein